MLVRSKRLAVGRLFSWLHHLLDLQRQLLLQFWRKLLDTFERMPQVFDHHRPPFPHTRRIIVRLIHMQYTAPPSPSPSPPRTIPSHHPQNATNQLTGEGESLMPRTQTAATQVARLEAEPLDLPLLEPFTISTGRMEMARNVLVRVTLADGTLGLGEAAPFPPSGGETQETALAAIEGMRPLLEGADAAHWRPLAHRLEASFEHQAPARAGIESALLDAFTRSTGTPLWHFFGGAGTQVTTDISIPIAEPGHVRELAEHYSDRGAMTLKIKVGTTIGEDIERVLAAQEGAPDCDLILDGNQGYTPATAIQLIATLAEDGVRPILFEQPVHRHDLEGLRFVTERAGVPVAADEAVHTAADALRIARLGAANAVNIKLMKSGLVEALDIAAVCRAAHLQLMIGAMLESRLGIAISAHLIAGLGGFQYVDLDTPMLMDGDPFAGGYEQDGMVYRLEGVAAGHGVAWRG